MRTWLRQEDWLHVARGLAIGETVRVPHKGDHSNRPNLVVSNKPDRWSAYCWSCKASGVQFKTHVKYQPKAPKESNSLVHPQDAVLVSGLPAYKQHLVAGFLARKGMDAIMLPPGLAFSETRQRLLVPTEHGLLGRDVTEAAHQKWLTYDRTAFLGNGPKGCVPVLVEDAFSYFKVRWAMQLAGMSDRYCAVCTLGTNPSAATVLHLLSMQPEGIIIMYDGDAAGASGADTVQRRMRALGVPCCTRLASWGHDPKDETAEFLQRTIMGAKWMQE